MSIFDMQRRQALATFEKEYITLHLYWNRGNIYKTAQKLEITRFHLIRLMRKYDLYHTLSEIRNHTYVAPKDWMTFIQPTAPEDAT